MTKKKGYYYITKDGDTYTVSVSPQMQEDMGAVTYVEFYDTVQVQAGDPVMDIEAAKTSLEAESPLAGTIVDRNMQAEDQPSILNSDQAEDNWLFKMTDVDEQAYQDLEDAE